MMLPDNVETVTVTATLLTPEGNPVVGKLTFTGPELVTIGAEDIIVLGSETVSLVDGSASIELLATDATGLDLVGWTYRVRARLGNAPSWVRYVLLPKATPTVDLADILLTEPNEGEPVAVPSHYVSSIANVSGVAAANNFMTLVNPTGSGVTMGLVGVFVSAGATGASGATEPMRGWRVSDVSGGVFMPPGDIGKFDTSDGAPVGEIRTGNPTVTLGTALFNSPAPTSSSQSRSVFVHQVDATGFKLVPGEGFVLRTSAGDTAQHWNLSIVWNEI